MKYVAQNGESNDKKWTLIKEHASLALAKIYTNQKKFKELIELLASENLMNLKKRSDKIFGCFSQLLRKIKEKVEINLGENIVISKIFSYFSA